MNIKPDGYTPKRIFCDGGVIAKNPSIHGGTWCFAWASSRTSKVVYHESGIITPEELELKTITNNVTELYAAMKALESVGKGWKGTLFTDSMVTIHRLNDSKAFNGIPNWIRIKILELRRFKKWKTIHVKGHPTQKHLESGMHPSGRPVHKVNVFCDEQCTQLASNFLQKLPKRIP